ncbi:MAG: DUF6941 family protein [Verrucomicrobiota bacterium]
MKLELFCICDAATEAGGKLNILGAFDRLWAREAPIVFNYCAVAARVRFSRIEEGLHRLRVSFADEDGHLVIPTMDSGIEIRFAGQDDSIPINLIVSLPQLRLAKFGDYAIDLAVDSNHLGSLPLLVRRAQEPHLPAPAGS